MQDCTESPGGWEPDQTLLDKWTAEGAGNGWLLSILRRKGRRYLPRICQYPNKGTFPGGA